MKVLQIVISAVALAALVSCSTLVSDKRIDYRAAAKQVPKLEVPPDLTAPEEDDRYKVPQSDSATITTYSDYSKGSEAQVRGPAVLPEVPGVRLVRDGARRWLLVNDKAEKVWPVVKTFWQETGLIISSEEQAAGVMETDWAENRAKIPQSAIRNVLGKVFENVYSSGERDQYLTRLERSNGGASTEVYITHRGIVEVFSKDKTTSKWQARANDPEMEAIMLQRLMVRFGASEAQATSAVMAAEVMAVSSAPTGSAEEKPVPGRPPEPVGTSSLREVTGGNLVIVVNDAFDRCWRRVGLAIESVGLGVEDKDRDQGKYFLRPVKVQSGWLEKLKFWKESAGAGKHYRINVDAKLLPGQSKDGGSMCEVIVTDQEGAASPITKQMTEAIYKNINQ